MANIPFEYGTSLAAPLAVKALVARLFLQRYVDALSRHIHTGEPLHFDIDFGPRHPCELCEKITARQKECLLLLCEGLSAKETASRMGISLKSAQWLRNALRKRLKLYSTAALVRFAIRHRMIEP